MNIIDVQSLRINKSIILFVIKQNENDQKLNNLNKYLRRYKMYRTQIKVN